jgi:hypothetical protein
MDQKLKKLGIVKIKPKDCACKNNAYVYRLPMRLGLEILDFLKPLGSPALSFEKTSLLKIENNDFAITGVKRLKEVRFSLKKQDKANLLQIFEGALIKYVEKHQRK